MTDTQTTVGVVAESGTDERRVALVPKAVASLVNSGVAVVVESGAGEGALLPDDLYTEAGATIGDAWARRRRRQGRTADRRRGRQAAQRADADRLPGAAQRRQLDRRAEAGRRAGVRARGHPANLARAGDGCAVVAGQRRRIQGGAARGLGVDAVLPDADDRGRHGEAGHRAGARRRRGRAAGAGHGQAAGRSHHRLRRAPGGGRPGALGGRAVAGRRHRCGRRGRVCPRAHRRGTRAAAEGAGRSDQRIRRGDHHRAGPGSPGAATGDRRGGARP